MSQHNPNPFARLDLLIFNLCAHGVRTYVEPHIGREIWDNGLDRVIAREIARAGIPQEPVSHIQIGNLSVPVDVLHILGQVCGLLPGRELPGAGS